MVSKMAENQNYKNQVLSEVELLEWLNVEQPTLDRLRLQKGFPVIRLNAKCRVYLVDEVFDWLKNHRINA